MTPEYFRTLFDYNYWARDRVLKVVLEMPVSEFGRENGFSLKSIRGILAHCVEAEHSWRRHLEGRASTGGPSEDEVATPAALVAWWREEEAQMRSYLAGLTQAMLAGDVVWVGSDGVERRLPNTWMTLTHVINHSTQHRSEAAEALTMIGRTPGNLDLGSFAGERRKR